MSRSDDLRQAALDHLKASIAAGTQARAMEDLIKGLDDELTLKLARELLGHYRLEEGNRLLLAEEALRLRDLVKDGEK